MPTGEYEHALYEQLDQALSEAQVKGYAFAIGDAQGQQVGVGCGGLSRDEGRPRTRLAFTPRTANNWGSVSKVVTAAAVLHAVENTPGASLDDPLSRYLPRRWQQLLHPDYAPVTVRMVMQHKGGFDRSGEIYELDESGDPVDLIAVRLSAPAERAVGQRSYSNLSAMLGHFVVASITDPAGMQAAEDGLEGAPSGEFSRQINLAAAHTYVDYVTANLLDPIGVQASCRITDFPGHAFFYASAEWDAGDYPRRVFDGEHTDECSTGGWVFSVEGMLGLLSGLRHGAILSEQSYALMENPDYEGNDALGYSSFQLVHDGLAFCHSGQYHFISSAVCSLPAGHQVVINTNSPPEGEADRLIDEIIFAHSISPS